MATHNVHADLVSLLHPVGGLRRYYRNARQGDVGLICESLILNGQYRPIVVNRGTHTGRLNEVLAGNHTLDAALELHWTHLAVTWVDVDDEAAARIVIIDNRANDQADYDQAALLELLQSLPDLAGTGYDPDDVDALLRDLTTPLDLSGLAGSQPVNSLTNPLRPAEEFAVLVVCADEAEQTRVMAELGVCGLNVRKLTA